MELILHGINSAFHVQFNVYDTDMFGWTKGSIDIVV